MRAQRKRTQTYTKTQNTPTTTYYLLPSTCAQSVAIVLGPFQDFGQTAVEASVFDNGQGSLPTRLSNHVFLFIFFFLKVKSIFFSLLFFCFDSSYYGQAAVEREHLIPVSIACQPDSVNTFFCQVFWVFW